MQRFGAVSSAFTNCQQIQPIIESALLKVTYLRESQLLGKKKLAVSNYQIRQKLKVLENLKSTVNILSTLQAYMVLNQTLSQRQNFE